MLYDKHYVLCSVDIVCMMSPVRSDINLKYYFVTFGLLSGHVIAVLQVHHQEVALGLAVAVTGLVTSSLILGTEEGHRTISRKEILSMC